MLYRYETYVLTFKNIVLGKDETLPVTGERTNTHCIVMRLLEGFEGKNRHIYMDNYYTSPPLFQEMARNGFGAAELQDWTDVECQRNGKFLKKERQKKRN